jgi:ABC-type phosphate/phosphonate transport system substrate-binding protein
VIDNARKEQLSQLFMKLAATQQHKSRLQALYASVDF